MNDPIVVCNEVYAETRVFHQIIDLGACDYGFKILYGPPVRRPPILFVGIQPGGSGEDAEREIRCGAHERWPAECEYATASWKLARNMQAMFGAEFLKGCSGLNALFFRSPGYPYYKGHIDKAKRKNIEDFCLPRVIRIIEAMQPRKIVLNAFETLRLFGGNRSDLISPKRGGDGILTRIGAIGGREVLGTLHLSGAYISTEDRKLIADRILEYPEWSR